jgi:hypothetical protein
MIHYTHSKDDLILICHIFELKIHNLYSISKPTLQKKIWSEINKLKEILPEREYFNVHNKKELLEYLEGPCENLNLSVREKKKVITIAKLITIYCREGYYEVRPHFLDFDHLIQSAIYIAQFGDISSVRKAIEKLNLDSRVKPKIEIKISNRQKLQIENQKKLLLNRRNHPYIRGCPEGKPFVITFD